MSAGGFAVMVVRVIVAVAAGWATAHLCWFGFWQMVSSGSPLFVAAAFFAPVTFVVFVFLIVGAIVVTYLATGTIQRQIETAPEDKPLAGSD